MYRTRGARGGSKLNRTLYESPATASLHSATPKRKNVPCFFDFSRGWIFSKMERTCENYFLVIWIFAKPRLISRPQKGVWGMNAGGFSFFGSGNHYFIQVKMMYELFIN